MLELHICNRNGALLRAFALGDAREVIVGRDEACDVRIVARSVSREHCSIEQQDDRIVLRDLGSSGGTFVDGARVDSITVIDGMEVAVGPAVLKFFDTRI
jgi:adenylate cyclase